VPALEHHTYSEDDVEEGGIKTLFFFFMKMAIFFIGRRLEKRSKIKFYFYSKSPILDVGGFAKQRIKKYLPKLSCGHIIFKIFPLLGEFHFFL
jgi:hypothetical protein